MKSWRQVIILQILTASTLAVVTLFAGGRSHAAAEPSSQTVVRFLIGSPGGFNQRGFVAEYAKALPNISLTLVNSKGGVTRLEELQDGEADLAVNVAHAAYLAYSGQLETTDRHFDRLRAISVLGVVPVHLVARKDSGIHSVTDLRGHAVSVGIHGGEMYRLSRSILAAYGVDFASIRAETGTPSDVSTTTLRAGKLDAMFVVGGYPAESVRAATAEGASYLVPMEGAPAERLRLNGRFLKVALIPAGTYPGQTTAIRTMGVQNILLVRRDLDEQVVYQLTKQFFAALPKLSQLVSSLRFMDLDQASATSIPLHDGAARYYRERELFR
jgi:uncharacterized protein